MLLSETASQIGSFASPTGTPEVLIPLSLTLKYDQSVDAAYIYLRKIKPGEVDKTISLEFTSGLARYPLRLDLTRSGELVGLEFLDASNVLPKDLLEETE